MTSQQPSVISNSPVPHSSRTLTFLGSYVSLAEIAEFVRQSAKEAGLSDFATYMVEMAVDEACSNVVEHAYGGEGKGEIAITCRNDPDRLTVIIRDHGRSFDPESIPNPNLQAGLDELPGHGLGLFFMRKWMDEVRFTSSPEGGNVLTMVKRKESQP